MEKTRTYLFKRFACRTKNVQWLFIPALPVLLPAAKCGQAQMPASTSIANPPFGVLRFSWVFSIFMHLVCCFVVITVVLLIIISDKKVSLVLYNTEML
jgi:hypothetical protein